MRVLVTRAEEQGRATGKRLEAAGHDAVTAPLTRTVLDGDTEITLDGVQALLVTSVNAVTALCLRSDADAFRALPTFAVGDRTARAAQDRGFQNTVSASGNRHDLVALVAARLDPLDGPILWAAGEDRTADLEDELVARGFSVRAVVVYRIEPVETLPEGVADDLRSGRIDAVAVYSPKSAEILVDALAARGITGETSSFRIHAISEAAAEPLRRAGFDRVVVAARPDEPGLLVTFVQSSDVSVADQTTVLEGASDMTAENKPERTPESVASEATAPEATATETTPAASIEPAAEATEAAAEPVQKSPAEAVSPEAPVEAPAEPAATTTDAALEAAVEQAVEPEAATEAPAPEAPAPVVAAAPVRRGIGGGTLAGAVVVASLVGGAIGIATPRLLGPQVDALVGPTTPAAPSPELKAALDRIAALEAQARAAADKPVDLAPLEKRLAALEAAPALKIPADLSARVEALQTAAAERAEAAKTSVAESLAKLPADGTALAQLATKVDQAIAAARESSAAEIARLKTELEATRAELAARGTDMGTEAKAALADATGRLSAEAEKRKADLDAAIDGFRKRLSGLEGLRAEVDGIVGRLGGVETSNAEAKADRGRIAETLDQTKFATEGLVGQVETKMAAIEAGAKAAEEAQARAVLAVALADLKSTVDAGRPFAGQLAVARRSAGGTGLPGLAPLDAFADKGVPSVTKLREELPKLARAMADAEEKPAGEESVLDRFTRNALSAVRIRPAGETAGESLSARVSRVEGRMTAGDLPGALAAWKTLPDKARAASASWGSALEARVAVDAALAAETAAVVSKLSAPK